MDSALLVGLGFLPSLVWLAFFIRRDLHPEPKYLITRTFLMGMILSPLAVGLQWIFVELGQKFYPQIFSFDSLHFFLWAAAVEEVVKFMAIRFMILNNPEFDEPVDAMIYMITASLGFAAIENILILFKSIPGGLDSTIQLWALRSVGATPLHALAGALSGYFLSLAWFYHHHEKKLIVMGLLLASIFHFTFNVLIFSFEEGPDGLFYSWLWLAVFGVLVHILFRKIRNRSARPPMWTLETHIQDSSTS
ncbi:MAG: PrsW family intramembrane metalloprotease [bacterium]|nr:PrsW family intramembrane metalloprotease [bacterium]